MKTKNVILIIGLASLAGYIYSKYIRPYRKNLAEIPSDIGVASIENTGVVYRNEGIIPQPVASPYTPQIKAQMEQFQKTYNTVSKAGSSAALTFLTYIKTQGYTVENGMVKYTG